MSNSAVTAWIRIQRRRFISTPVLLKSGRFLGMRSELRIAGEERPRLLHVDDDRIENGLVAGLVSRRALPILRGAVAEAIDGRLDLLPVLARPWVHHAGRVQELHELVTRLG